MSSKTKNDEIELTSVLMNQPFNPTDINITAKQLTIDLLIKRLQANPREIDLSPSFQRKGDLWNEVQQSQLIESLLIKFPLPAFYFDGTDDNKWLVIDGLQRLCALDNFVIKKTLKLNGLEFLSDKLQGKGFDDLERSRQRDIEEAQITAYIINAGTPDEVKFNLFKRLNTNGLTLEPQEIRHAMNQGVPTEFIQKLASLPEFKTIFGNKKVTRMIDCEYVTRFVAFYIRPYSEYQPDLDPYLNQKMKELRSLSPEELEATTYNFTASLKLAYEIFGEYAFRKVNKRDGKKYPLNKALFEVWTVALAHLSDSERRKIYEKKKIVFDTFIALMDTDREFVEAISVGTREKNKVTTRFERIHKLVQEVLS